MGAGASGPCTGANSKNSINKQTPAEALGTVTGTNSTPSSNASAPAAPATPAAPPAANKNSSGTNKKSPSSAPTETNQKNAKVKNPEGTNQKNAKVNNPEGTNQKNAKVNNPEATNQKNPEGTNQTNAKVKNLEATNQKPSPPVPSIQNRIQQMKNRGIGGIIGKAKNAAKGTGFGALASGIANQADAQKAKLAPFGMGGGSRKRKAGKRQTKGRSHTRRSHKK